MQAEFPGMRVTPETWVLPHELEKFEEFREDHEGLRTIVKPCAGMLGRGIRVLPSGAPFSCPPPEELHVAQVYIESALIDGRKFDFRVYALIASVTPLVVLVHRQGIARFATEPASRNTAFAMLTNTAVNRTNPRAPDDMTRTIQDVLRAWTRCGVDTQKVWRAVEETVVLALLSGVDRLKECDPPSPYPFGRAFQLFGLDVLFDEGLRPYVLEVNTRPSMKSGAVRSYEVKRKVVADALEVVLPPRALQDWVDELPRVPETVAEMMEMMPPEVRDLSMQRLPTRGNEFNLVYKEGDGNELFDRVYERVMGLGALEAVEEVSQGCL